MLIRIQNPCILVNLNTSPLIIGYRKAQDDLKNFMLTIVSQEKEAVFPSRTLSQA